MLPLSPHLPQNFTEKSSSEFLLCGCKSILHTQTHASISTLGVLFKGANSVTDQPKWLLGWHCVVSSHYLLIQAPESASVPSAETVNVCLLKSNMSQQQSKIGLIQINDIRVSQGVTAILLNIYHSQPNSAVSKA